jgi:predicted DCC family thiol-disulfide oxidoreductase YuxK
MCRRWAAKFERLLTRNGFRLVPLQSPIARGALQLPETELLKEMRVVTNGRKVFGGADALLYIASVVPIGKPFYLISRFPGVRPILHRAYRWVARNRTCEANKFVEPPFEG